jgi:TRAP transporter TAXI family solute receptor
MKRLITVLIVALNFLSASSDISSGSRGGTYIEIAKEIAQTIAKDIGLNMRVVESTGSKANIENLIKNQDVKFAIVQHDIIELLKRSKKKEYHRLLKDIRVLVPLYLEEVHIIVRKDSNIRYLEDIKDRKVAIGPKGSGTALTAFLIYEMEFGKGSLTADMIDRSSLEDALKKLDNREVDVVFAVGAQPISALNRDGEYRLIPVTSPKVLSNYYDATIKRYSYPWLKEDIKTAGVYSLLVCNKANSIPAYKMREFGRDFARRLNYLKEYGHKRWIEVKKRLPALPSTQKWRYCREFKRGWDDFINQYSPSIHQSNPNSNCTPEERALDLCH